MHFFLVAHHLHLLTQTAVSALMLQYSICSVEHLAISNQLPFLNREEMKRLGRCIRTREAFCVTTGLMIKSKC
jgi:hypothetical protein